jgi:hypothetical protein
MAMTKRARSKGRERSERLLGVGTQAHGYCIGLVGPDPRGPAGVMVAVLAGSIALSFVVFGFIIVPGLLLLRAIFGAIDRPVSATMTNEGMAVLARSEFNGRPRKVLTVLSHAALANSTIQRSGSLIHLPEFQLWFREKEYKRLFDTAGTTTAPNPRPEPVTVGVVASTQGGPDPEPAWNNGTAAVAPAHRTVAPAPALQPENENGVIYCSWCGKERALNAQAIHHCGSRERPAVFCMQCGAPLESADNCARCGTPATQLSR